MTGSCVAYQNTLVVKKLFKLIDYLLNKIQKTSYSINDFKFEKDEFLQ